MTALTTARRMTRSEGGLLLNRLAGAVILGQFAYAFAFNYLSVNLRLDIAAALLVLQIGLSAWALIARPATWSILIVVALCGQLLSWTVSVLTGTAAPASEAEVVRLASHEFVAYVVSIWLLTFATRLPYKLLCFLSLASAAIAAVLALAGDPVVIVDSPRLAAFTGGDAPVPGAGNDVLGLHASAYFVLLCLFLIDGFRRTGAISGKLAVPVMAVLFVLILEYEVRTAIVMLAAYALGHLWWSRWRALTLEIGLLGLACVLIYVAGAFVLTDFDVLRDANSWGSGRGASYQFRIALLSQRDLLPLIFGTGPGSDAFRIPIWWWDEMEAHSDVLHTLVETGLAGLISMGIFFGALWARLSPVSRPLVLSLLACTAVSNGVLTRPTDLFLLVVAMAVAESAQDRPPDPLTLAKRAGRGGSPLRPTAPSRDRRRGQ